MKIIHGRSNFKISKNIIVFNKIVEFDTNIYIYKFSNDNAINSIKIIALFLEEHSSVPTLE